MHSVAEAARFDTELCMLPARPEGLSSTDAVEVDEVLYVIGGWRRHGGMFSAFFGPGTCR